MIVNIIALLLGYFSNMGLKALEVTNGGGTFDFKKWFQTNKINMIVSAVFVAAIAFVFPDFDSIIQINGATNEKAAWFVLGFMPYKILKAFTKKYEI